MQCGWRVGVLILSVVILEMAIRVEIRKGEAGDFTTWDFEIVIV